MESLSLSQIVLHKYIQNTLMEKYVDKNVYYLDYLKANNKMLNENNSKIIKKWKKLREIKEVNITKIMFTIKSLKVRL